MPLINNYGLFWKRDRVMASTAPPAADATEPINPSGGWPRSGPLHGVGVRKRRQGVVDFADQRGIYALYDEQFRLVYVGQAGRRESRLYSRLRTHTRSVLSERWSRFSWFGIMPVGDADGGPTLLEVDDGQVTVGRSDILDHIEAVLILAGEPLRNKQGGILGAGVTHYRQYKGGDIDPRDAGEDPPE